MMKVEYFVGIDPGKQGAIAVVDRESTLMQLELLGDSPQEVDRAISKVFYHNTHMTCEIFLEKVHAMPGQGVSTMFSFGKHYGWIEGIITANGEEINYVHPSQWTKAMHRHKGRTAKEKSVKAAQELWPEETFLATRKSRTPHQGLVDASLIAEYGRRYTLGLIKKVKK